MTTKAHVTLTLPTVRADNSPLLVSDISQICFYYSDAADGVYSSYDFVAIADFAAYRLPLPINSNYFFKIAIMDSANRITLLASITPVNIPYVSAPATSSAAPAAPSNVAFTYVFTA